MCSRYDFTTPAEAVRQLFEVSGPLPNVPRLADIRPTDQVPIVRPAAGGGREMVMARWWLVPHWAKELKSRYPMFNARAETLAEKPAFRDPFRRRRCLLPGDAFYEWKDTPAGKVKYRITLEDGAPFAMAGLWDRWEPGAEGPVESCTIVTTEANALVATIHAKKRMPVILDPADYAAWLDAEATPPAAAQALLGPYSAEAMTARPEDG